MDCASGSSQFAVSALEMNEMTRSQQVIARASSSSSLSSIVLVDAIRPMDCHPRPPRSFRFVHGDDFEKQCQQVDGPGLSSGDKELGSLAFPGSGALAPSN